MSEARTSGQAGAPPVTEASGAADPGQMFAAALQNHRQRRMAEAEGLYRQVLAVDPNHVDALHMLGVLAYQAGRPEAAVDLIGRAIGLYGENASFHNNIGEALRYLGRLDEAGAHFTKATELDPSAAESHMNLGNVLKQQGHLEQAIERYRRALELKPDYAEAHLNLGVARMAQGKEEEAADHYGHALGINPRFPEALMNLAIVLQHRGEFEDAVAHYRRALDLRPQSAAAHFNLGNALLERGNLNEALARYQHALATAAGAAPPTRALAPGESIPPAGGEPLARALSGRRAVLHESRPGQLLAHAGAGLAHAVRGGAETGKSNRAFALRATGAHRHQPMDRWRPQPPDRHVAGGRRGVGSDRRDPLARGQEFARLRQFSHQSVAARRGERAERGRRERARACGDRRQPLTFLPRHRNRSCRDFISGQRPLGDGLQGLALGESRAESLQVALARDPRRAAGRFARHLLLRGNRLPAR